MSNSALVLAAVAVAWLLILDRLHRWYVGRAERRTAERFWALSDAWDEQVHDRALEQLAQQLSAEGRALIERRK